MKGSNNKRNKLRGVTEIVNPNHKRKINEDTSWVDLGSGNRPTNSTAQTFGLFYTGTNIAVIDQNTGQDVTAVFGGLGGVEAVSSPVTYGGEGGLVSVDPPNYNQLALAGFAKPIGKYDNFMRKSAAKKASQINNQLDASEDFTQKINADALMKARVEEAEKIYTNLYNKYEADKKAVDAHNENINKQKEVLFQQADKLWQRVWSNNEGSVGDELVATYMKRGGDRIDAQMATLDKQYKEDPPLPEYPNVYDQEYWDKTDPAMKSTDIVGDLATLGISAAASKVLLPLIVGGGKKGLELAKGLGKWWNKGRNIRVANENNASFWKLIKDDMQQVGKFSKGKGTWYPKNFSEFKQIFTGEGGIVWSFTRGVKTGPTPAIRQAFERLWKFYTLGSMTTDPTSKDFNPDEAMEMMQPLPSFSDQESKEVKGDKPIKTPTDTEPKPWKGKTGVDKYWFDYGGTPQDAMYYRWGGGDASVDAGLTPDQVFQRGIAYAETDSRLNQKNVHGEPQGIEFVSDYMRDKFVGPVYGEKPKLINYGLKGGQGLIKNNKTGTLKTIGGLDTTTAAVLAKKKKKKEDEKLKEGKTFKNFMSSINN